MLEVIIPPTAEPITLKEARIHLRQAADGDSPATPSPNLYEALPDDSWVEAKITAAREAAEQFLGYPLTDAVYRITFRDFFGSVAPGPGAPDWFYRAPGAFVWPRPTGLQLPPFVAEIVGVDYLDATTHVSTTLDPAAYTFDPVTSKAYPVDAWPSVSSRDMPVRVRIRGLYGLDASPPLLVPQSIKHAILLMVGEWNENRQLSLAQKAGEIPLGIEFLLRPYRTRLGFA